MVGRTPHGDARTGSGQTDATDTPTLAAPTVESGAVTGATPGGSHDRPLEPGATVGRYVVLGILGAGGMGVVYAAFDPELDRRVALKLVLASQVGTHSSQGTARLLREAQAMAKLTHPNVVTVHDVGTVGERVFVAMEHVAGVTFTEWHKRDVPWRERVKRYVDAARGLHAAHEVGLVHRDFKPDNVMVGDDGRVRVMDFGIAHGARATETVDEYAAERDRGGTPAGDGTVAPAPDRLTRTGSMMGTPAYMSPEQHLGSTTDGRSDQFSFCVALWEGLFGERPFAGTTLAQIAVAVSEGEVREPPRDAKVPLAVRRVIQRGLMSNPDERWESMAALHTALADAASPRRTGPLWTAGIVGALGIAGGAAVVSAQRTPEPCAQVADAASEVWSAAVHERIRGGFVGAAGSKFGADTAERTIVELDGWVDGWSAERVDACEATHVRHEQSGELLDLRMSCLDDQLGSLRALLDAFATPDREIVRKALEAAGRLGDPDACADVDALRERLPMPTDADAVARIEALRDDVRRGKALHDLGRYAESIELVRGAMPGIREVAYPPLTARALVNLGAVLREHGELDEATTALREAYYLSVEHGVAPKAGNAALQLAHVIGYSKREIEPGKEWLAAGEAWAKRTGNDELMAALDRVRATVLFASGEYDAAIATHRKSIARVEAEHGARSPKVGVAYGTLAVLGHAASKLDEAEEAARHAIDILTETYGPEHPDTASAIQNLGLVEHQRGNYKAAMKSFEHTLRVYEATLDPDSPDIAQTLDNVANAQSWLGDNPGALETYARARGIYERSLGPRHPKVGQQHNSIGGVYKEMGRLEDARTSYETALEIMRESSGDDHPGTAYPLNNLGNLYHQLGEDDRAEEAYLKALELLASKNGPDHVTTSFPMTGLGFVAQARGDYEAALDWYGKSLAIKEKQTGKGSDATAGVQHSIGSVHLARKDHRACVESATLAYEAYGRSAPHSMFTAAAGAVLAQCRWALGDARGEAMALAKASRDDLAAAGAGAATDLEKIEAWIAAHGG